MQQLSTTHRRTHLGENPFVIVNIQQVICYFRRHLHFLWRTCVIGSTPSHSLLSPLLSMSSLLLSRWHSPAACACVRAICAASAHTDVSCLTFGLRLNSLSLTVYPQPARSPHLGHRGLSSAALCPSPCRPARSSLSVGYRAALRPFLPRRERDLYLPSRPPPPSESTSGVYQPVQGGGVCRREIQTRANRCGTHQ